MTIAANAEELERTLLACDELLRISHAQRQAIDDEDIDRLNDLLTRRESLISTLNLSAVAMTPGADRLAACTSPSESPRSLIVERIRELLLIDEDNQKLVQAMLTQVGSGLASMARGRRALREYSYLKPGAEPVYVDRRR